MTARDRAASAIDKADAPQVDATLLRAWPLPPPQADGDKESRGRALIIGGSPQMPGGAWLAGVAALRAGAGKLAVATAGSVAAGLALRLPEARVIALPELESGGLAVEGVERLDDCIAAADAVLVGPGLDDQPASFAFVRELLRRDAMAATKATLILDALAMNVAGERFARPVVLTPHAGEMAHPTGLDKAAIGRDQHRVAAAAARQWNAVVVLKGSTTWIAAPDGRAWRHDGGSVGLATSGSGDTLAGIMAGLAARGAPIEQAAVWGVALHARAGDAIAARLGPVGLLASELAAEVPAIMHALSSEAG